MSFYPLLFLASVFLALPVFQCESEPFTTSPPHRLNLRPGRASTTHSCHRIRKVPRWLRKKGSMELSRFYKKYTEAYKIPIVSSANVPDDAVKRACYVMRFLAADHAGIRQAIYRNWGRVGVIATSEEVTSIPEHSHLDPVYWHERARALGATKALPISTAPEENLLCYKSDSWYPNQDIMVHELNHGVHMLGAVDAIAGWDEKLEDLYYRRRAENDRWSYTYSMSSYLELFSEGAQIYFNVNSYSQDPNGREGPINTREKLKDYDLPLYSLIKQVFPCGNTILDRCNSSREQEQAQVLKMDCEYEPVEGVSDEDFQMVEHDPNCVDFSDYCPGWKAEGHCVDTYQQYMSKKCPRSCGTCGLPPGPNGRSRKLELNL